MLRIAMRSLLITYGGITQVWYLLWVRLNENYLHVSENMSQEECTEEQQLCVCVCVHSSAWTRFVTGMSLMTGLCENLAFVKIGSLSEWQLFREYCTVGLVDYNDSFQLTWATVKDTCHFILKCADECLLTHQPHSSVISCCQAYLLVLALYIYPLNVCH
jgi:hypothetical protein